MRLIDADALYERATTLEAQALDYVGKLIERDGDEPSVEWKIWSAILAERTAFKHDLMDAPTVDAVDVVKDMFKGEMKLMPAEDVLTMDRPQGEWIPCSERLPKDLEVVNITWINHRPMTYYADIKDKPFTATAIHCKNKWWWYSPICEDMLAEYGKSECDKMDADIEVTAWMALPEPWKGGRQ